MRIAASSTASSTTVEAVPLEKPKTLEKYTEM